MGVSVPLIEQGGKSEVLSDTSLRLVSHTRIFDANSIPLGYDCRDEVDAFKEMQNYIFETAREYPPKERSVMMHFTSAVRSSSVSS